LIAVLMTKEGRKKLLWYNVHSPRIWLSLQISKQ
jgi:hypothetical protein